MRTEKQLEKHRQRRKIEFSLFGVSRGTAPQWLKAAATLPGSRNALAPAQKWPAMTVPASRTRGRALAGAGRRRGRLSALPRCTEGRARGTKGDYSALQEG